MSPIERDPRTGKRYLSARGRSWLLIAILFVAGVFSIYNYFVDRNQSTQDQTQKQDLRAAAVESCEIGNRGRVIRINDYRRDIAQLRAQVKTLEANLQVISFVPKALFASGDLTQQEIVEINNETIRRSRLSIRYKRRTIDREIASIAQTAVAPGSPVSDCSRRLSG